MNKFRTIKFPRSRIATIDVFEAGRRRHHVAGLLEVDVTKTREEIRIYNRGKNEKISFTAWMISVIGRTIKHHETAASFLKGKNRLMVFEDVNVSLLVEKNLSGRKVPMPLVIEKANEISIESITAQIADARKGELSEQDIVLKKKSGRLEKLYYTLPGFLRRYIWKYLIKHPKLAFKKMGNVAFTSVGMMGKVNGWFIPASVHPVCFGIGSVMKKPVVTGDEIVIREMLNMTVLLDHDVIDGANMARFISELVTRMEQGIGSDKPGGSE